jgi:chromosome segregation ATPase
MKKVFFVLAIAFVAAGCAAGRNNYQSDIDAMNGKIAGLQSQLDSKNRELAGLQDQQRMTAQQLDAANRAKADADSRLNQALDKLASRPATTADTTSVKKSSYIK